MTCEKSVIMVRSLVFLVALVLPASLLAVEYKDLVDRFEKLEKQEPLSGAGHREWLVERVDVSESMIELAQTMTASNESLQNSRKV